MIAHILLSDCSFHIYSADWLKADSHGANFFWVHQRFFISHGMGCMNANDTVQTVRLRSPVIWLRNAVAVRKKAHSVNGPLCCMLCTNQRFYTLFIWPRISNIFNRGLSLWVDLDWFNGELFIDLSIWIVMKNSTYGVYLFIYFRKKVWDIFKIM